MASYLTANPDDAECIAFARQYGVMVPIARDGALLCLVNHRHLDKMPLASPLPVEDFVVGLEMLGYQFHLWNPHDGSAQKVFRQEPEDDLPPAWARQEWRIMLAFGGRRWEEIAAFLRLRDSGPDTPTPTPSALPLAAMEESQDAA